MLIFEDGSGHQEYPKTSPQPHIVADDATADRIRNGDRYRVEAGAVVFLTAEEIEAEALEAEKADAEGEARAAALAALIEQNAGQKIAAIRAAKTRAELEAAKA